MKKLIFVFLVLLVFSCKENEQKPSTDAIITSNTLNEQQWLIESLTNYFKEEYPDASKITTPEYYEYKLDAINVDLGLDESLTKEQFITKWKSKFDVQKAGINEGFFIDAQDFGEVVVTKCEPLISAEKEKLFKVVLEDKTFKSSFTREIKVVKTGDSYRIADVRE